jgi:hypothetical protein
VASRYYKGHVGTNRDVAGTVEDLCAVEGVKPAVTRPHLAEARLLVEDLDLS